MEQDNLKFFPEVAKQIEVSLNILSDLPNTVYSKEIESVRELIQSYLSNQELEILIDLKKSVRTLRNKIRNGSNTFRGIADDLGELSNRLNDLEKNTHHKSAKPIKKLIQDKITNKPKSQRRRVRVNPSDD